MGKCWKCGTEVILKDEETRCDRCKEIIRYWCNGCAKPFDVQDRETKKKIKECKWCYYFICPYCNTCSQTCPKFEHQNKIRGFLKDIISIDMWEKLNMNIKKIVDYFEDIKLGKEQTRCEFGVPKSYAKERIKQILARMKGFKVRDGIDQEAFEERLKEITDKELGYELTINNSRSNGSYGQEYRDVFNLCVCMGTLKWRKKKYKNKKGIETSYDCWERVEENQCQFLDTKELIVKECPDCYKTFTRDKSYCDECIYKRKSGEHQKGELKEIPLREKLSNNPTCENIKNFKRRIKKDGDIEGKIKED